METPLDNPEAARAAQLDKAMLSPGTICCRGIMFRRISFMSQAMLDRAGNPLASPDYVAALNSAPRWSQLAEYVFVHGGEPSLVRECIYRRPDRLAEEADVFCAALPPDAVGEIFSMLKSDAADVRAAQAEVIPDAGAHGGVKSGASKNGQRPAAQPR